MTTILAFAFSLLTRGHRGNLKSPGERSKKGAHEGKKWAVMQITALTSGQEASTWRSKCYRAWNVQWHKPM